MRKIPTLFVRDPDNPRHVVNEVTSGCEWVLAGEGVATRKFDGTCVMLDEHGNWWARREVKPGKPTPPGFVALSTDDNTGKTVGWEPVGQSAFARYHAEAAARRRPGTYELCGPKVNGNPEGYIRHLLVRHAAAATVHDVPRDYPGLARFMVTFPHEGIVWHHPDGRMAKLKRRDFPREAAGE